MAVPNVRPPIGASCRSNSDSRLPNVATAGCRRTMLDDGARRPDTNHDLGGGGAHGETGGKYEAGEKFEFA